MEIKTIIRPLTLRSYSTQFDAEVNAALKEGWELTEVRPLNDGAELCATQGSFSQHGGEAERGDPENPTSQN